MRSQRIVTLGGLLLASTLLLSTASIAAAAVPPPAPPPVPKPSAAMPATQTVVTVSDDEVTIREPRPGGGLILRMYRARPTSNGHELLSVLQRRGAAPRGVTTLAEADPTECASSYGSAKYLCLKTTPQYKFNWRWNGFADPQVYFRDHTPSAWPVRASVTEWHKAVGVDSYWTTGNCPTGGRHCVDVYSGDYGIDWVGYVYMEVDSYAFFIDGKVRVYLNNRYSSTEDNRGTACHELGHALGLAHNGSRSSCLYWTSIDGPDPRLPHSTDYSVLRYVLYAD